MHYYGTTKVLNNDNQNLAIIMSQEQPQQDNVGGGANNIGTVLISFLFQHKTIVDLVRLPAVHLLPLQNDEQQLLLRILAALAAADDGAGSNTIEELRLPRLDVSHVEALAACLVAHHATLHTISVQELTSDRAISDFCRAMISGMMYDRIHDHCTKTMMIRRLALGRTDQMLPKVVSIVGCNALGNLLEHPDTAFVELCLKSLRLSHPRIFCRGLAGNHRLTTLRLQNVHLDNQDDGFSTLLHALSHVPLETLDIEDMDIDVLLVDDDDDNDDDDDDDEDDDSSYVDDDNNNNSHCSVVHEGTAVTTTTRPNNNPWLDLPRTLRTLRIAMCSLCTPEVEAICQGLDLLPNLQQLTLSSNDLLPSAAMALGRLLSSSPVLQQVNLNQNLLGTTGVATLLSFGGGLDRTHHHHHSRLSLELQSNNIRDLSAILEKATTTGTGSSIIHRLHRLDLSDNPLGTSSSTTTHNNIIRAPTICTTTPSLADAAVHLKILRLDGCGLTDADIAIWCTMVPSSVTELGLANNVIHENGAEAIRQLLAEDGRAIVSLDLSSCHITDTALDQLLLPSSSSLRHGPVETTTATSSTPPPHDVTKTSLRELYLAFNQIGNDGLVTIATYLRRPDCQLQTLNLQFNDFGAMGLRHVESALAERNTSLQDLYFWNNHHELDDGAFSSSSVSPPLTLSGGGGAGDSPERQLTTTTIPRRINHWLSLNKAGVRQALALMGEGTGGIDRPSRGLWAPILARADRIYGASAVYYLLQNRPDLVYGNRPRIDCWTS
jgi:Ran GTPase-activating protein (RanGAP) involved in mRNA processing and transport